MNAYACFPDLPSPVQRYIRTLEADKEALEADRAALEARAAVAARRIAELSERVRYLEEQFRLAQLKRYAPRSEKPREVWVWQHVRFKYGCRHCERHEIRAPVVRAEMPAQPLPGSVASAATIAT